MSCFCALWNENEIPAARTFTLHVSIASKVSEVIRVIAGIEAFVRNTGYLILPGFVIY